MHYKNNIRSRDAKHFLGQAFGRLTVIGNGTPMPDGDRAWDCTCSCGATVTLRASSVKRGLTKSCGCLQNSIFRSTHRDSNSPEYCAWQGMKERCGNPKNTRYPNYGGRGIKVRDRWINSFENFLADMGRKPTPEHSLDRIDVNGHYEPSNCRWATPSEQMTNMTTNRFLTLNGETLCITQWAARLGMVRATIERRLRVGWSVEKALTHPVRTCRRRRPR